MLNSLSVLSILELCYWLLLQCHQMGIVYLFSSVLCLIQEMRGNAPGVSMRFSTSGRYFDQTKSDARQEALIVLAPFAGERAFDHPH